MPSTPRTGPRPGTAQSALRHRDFRIVWTGTFTSNIGTWMQNVLLGAYGYTLTRSAAYVGVLYFAQLGPLLLLSILGSDQPVELPLDDVEGLPDES